MFKQRNKWLIAVTVCVVIIWASWNMEKGKSEIPVDEENQADYSMEQFRAINMGDDGKPNYWLNSKYMTHDIASNVTQLEEPFITFFQENDASWELNAHNGQHYGYTDELFLLGEVNISRNSNQGPTLIKTTDLRLLPKENFGETQNKVTMILPNGSVTAQGMNAYFSQHRISFLSNVKGQYVPAE